MVLKEVIFKQGQAVNNKTSKRLCTLDYREFKWYHDEKELQKRTPLGVIPIKCIYQTLKSKMTWLTQPTMMISTTNWINKQEEDEGKRDFYFACDTVVQLEKWIITIEYLRTKAVYETYMEKNVPVQFRRDSEQPE